MTRIAPARDRRFAQQEYRRAVFRRICRLHTMRRLFQFHTIRLHWAGTAPWILTETGSSLVIDLIGG